MSILIGKFLRHMISSRKSNFGRFLSASQFKLSESDVEEIEIPMPWGHIAGKWWGDKSIPPVLAIHGWLDNASSFDRLIPHLNVQSVLSIDLPGHGYSSHLPEGRAFDFAEHIIMLHRVKKHFNWQEVPLLAHSIGSALGYIYASIFSNDIKWIINFECARTLVPFFRTDICGALSEGIDELLSLEKLKRNSPPTYKLSNLIIKLIEGSLGSIANPEVAMHLLKRGAYTTEKSSIEEVDKRHSNFTMEGQAIKVTAEEDSKHLQKLYSQRRESLKKIKEDVNAYLSGKEDDKYYAFRRDALCKILIFQTFNKEFVIEASRTIKCPVLSLRAKNGYIFGSNKKLYEETLDIMRAKSKYLEHHEVDGTHHAHLNNPELLAPIINNFIQKCETLKRKWWGPKNRRPILCIHGWQDNANSFSTLIPQLSPEFSYLAIDIPGHGFSSRYPLGFFYQTYEMATIIRRLQHHFDWTKVSLIGHSYGSICSFLFCSLFPNSVDFYVAIDAIKPLSKDFAKEIKEAATKIEKLLVCESLDLSTAPCYTKESLMKIWIKSSNNALTEKSCEFLIQRGTIETDGLFKIIRDPRVKHNFSVNFSHTENLKLAEAINCKVLFLKAKEASYFEKKDLVLEVLDIIKSKAKYFEEHLVTGTHYIHLNNPEVVAPLINSFIQTVAEKQELTRA